MVAIVTVALRPRRTAMSACLPVAQLTPARRASDAETAVITWVENAWKAARRKWCLQVSSWLCLEWW